MITDALAPFWSHVEPTGFCWSWTGGTNGRYGQMQYGGSPKMAHRISYELMVGEIPTGMVIDHLCRNTLCVNPDHLEPVTQKINIERSIRIPSRYGEYRRSMTHCKRGHPLSGENLYVHQDKRHCRACRKAAKVNV
jgi:hypothetical protein